MFFDLTRANRRYFYLSIYIHNNTFQRCKLLNGETCITGIEKNG